MKSKCPLCFTELDIILKTFHLGTSYLRFTKLNTCQILTWKFYKFTSHFSTLQNMHMNHNSLPNMVQRSLTT